MWHRQVTLPPGVSHSCVGGGGSGEVLSARSGLLKLHRCARHYGPVLLRFVCVSGDLGGAFSQKKSPATDDEKGAMRS